jgi:hypothetical protein
LHCPCGFNERIKTKKNITQRSQKADARRKESLEYQQSHFFLAGFAPLISSLRLCVMILPGLFIESLPRMRIHLKIIKARLITRMKNNPGYPGFINEKSDK